MANIGEVEREVEVVPLTAPIVVPVPATAPVEEPAVTPEREPVPV